MVKTEIKFKTLTPIWTGDADRKCTTIKDTSIIGSMRWWYEAIVRGLEGYACDPSNGGCEFNTKGYEAALKKGKSVDEALEIGLKKVCPACMLFGCTGWRRRFRLEVEDQLPVQLVLEDKINDFNAETWVEKTFLNSKAFYSTQYFKLYLVTEDKEIENTLLFLLNFIEKVGSIGSKSQNGFGLIKFDELNPDFDLNNLKNQVYTFNENNKDKLQISKDLNNLGNIQKLDHLRNLQNLIHLRNLQNLYLFNVKFISTDNFETFLGFENYDQNLLLSGFILKYFLRNEFKSLEQFEINSFVLNAPSLKSQRCSRFERERYKFKNKYKKTSKIVARALFGSDLNDKWTSFVEISHIYKVDGVYKFRVLCNIPQFIKYDRISIEFNRKEVIKKIQSLLMANFPVEVLEDLSEEKIDVEDLSVVNILDLPGINGDEFHGN